VGRSTKPASSLLAGRRSVLELLRSGSPAERVLIARELKPSSVIGEIRRRAERASVPVRLVPRAELDRLADGINHQGVVALTARYRYMPVDRILHSETPAVLFLDGIMDPQNLGSLLRSADGAGFSGVVLPARRAVGVTDSVRRVAAGAAEVVPVARVDSLGNALDDARKAGLWIVGMDEKSEADLWSSDLLDPPVALVLGAEDRGLSKGVQARCDTSVRIPSEGRLGALNVAAAGAVAMFEVARRRAHKLGQKD
jgi:23S rRNA (guanosine2251-2'-O)-methyltransferase